MNCVIIELGLHLCADALNAIWQNLIPNKRVPTAFFFPQTNEILCSNNKIWLNYLKKESQIHTHRKKELS